MTEKAIVIGSFYELPGGTIARTAGWDGPKRLVTYALDDGLGPRTAPEADVAGAWTPRPDLTDYPNARDPRLPNIFDLVWDAKRRSDLPPLLADSGTAGEVEEALREHGIALTETETAEVEALRDTARLSGW